MPVHSLGKRIHFTFRNRLSKIRVKQGYSESVRHKVPLSTLSNFWEPFHRQHQPLRNNLAHLLSLDSILPWGHEKEPFISLRKNRIHLEIDHPISDLNVLGCNTPPPKDMDVMNTVIPIKSLCVCNRGNVSQLSLMGFWIKYEVLLGFLSVVYEPRLVIIQHILFSFVILHRHEFLLHCLLYSIGVYSSPTSVWML